MRRILKQIGVKQNYPYPTYAVVKTKYAPSRFDGESSFELPLDDIAESTSFTIGDSFPALHGRTTPGRVLNRELCGSKVINLEDLTGWTRKIGWISS